MGYTCKENFMKNSFGKVTSVNKIILDNKEEELSKGKVMYVDSPWPFSSLPL